VIPDAWALSMRFDSIFMGCAAALLYQRAPRVRLAGRRFTLAALGVLLLFLVVGRSDLAGRWTTPAFALVAAAAVLAVLDSRAVPAPLVFVGQISYALYLWHVPIYRIARDSALTDTLGPDGVRVLALAATFVAATVSYYAVEQPFLRRKWRLARTHSHDEPVAGDLSMEPSGGPVPAESVG
jgi:peptidoglycan/LPS O-acetylase OafA/YrhL